MKYIWILTRKENIYRILILYNLLWLKNTPHLNVKFSKTQINKKTFDPEESTLYKTRHVT
jgi:hypothetical protein